MRSDKDLVDHNSCSPAITILVSHLEFHLKRKGLKYNTVLLKNLQQIYEGSCKSGVAHTFLSLSTTLTDIPRGRKARKSADTVYQRSIQITKAASVPTPYLSLKKVSHWYNGYWEAYHVTLENQCS